MSQKRRSMPEDFAEILKQQGSYDRLKAYYRAGGSTVARWKREYLRRLRDATLRAEWKKYMKSDSDSR